MAGPAMIDKVSVDKLSVKKLDIDPERYSFSAPTAEQGTELVESIKRFGVLHPLICIDNGEAGLLVVAGARRLGALPKDSEVQVRVVYPDSKEQVWELLLEEHLLAGAPNAVEVGLYLKKRMADTGESLEELAEKVFERLGLTPRAQAANESLWIADFDPEVRQRFVEDELPDSGLKILIAAPLEDVDTILKLTRGMRMGRNKFMELARWLMECAWRDGVGVEELAGALSCEAEKPLAELNAQELRQLVWRKRYPNLSGWSEEFELVRKRLGLPKQASLAHSPGFEGGKLKLGFTFGSLEELERALREVEEKLDAGELKGLEKFLS